MKTSIIFLFLFVTPIIGSGKGSSSKRGRFKPDHYLDEESSETETEQSHIGGTSSTDPNVYGGTQTLNLETVTIQEQENPQQILPNNIVAMKKIPYEKANSNKSKAYRYKWIEEVEEGLNNYHLAEGIKDKMIYIGCDRCRRYFYFEAKVNFMPHNKSHKKLNERMHEISNDGKIKQKLESRIKTLNKKHLSSIKNLDEGNFLRFKEKALCFECEACKVDGLHFLIFVPIMAKIERHLKSQDHKDAVKRYNTAEERSIKYDNVVLDGKQIMCDFTNANTQQELPGYYHEGFGGLQLQHVTSVDKKHKKREKCLIIDGYKYSINKKAKDSVYRRCVVKDCKGRVISRGGTHIRTNEHTICEPSNIDDTEDVVCEHPNPEQLPYGQQGINYQMFPYNPHVYGYQHALQHNPDYQYDNQMQQAIDQSAKEMFQKQQGYSKGPMIREPTSIWHSIIRGKGHHSDDPKRKGKEIDLNEEPETDSD